MMKPKFMPLLRECIENGVMRGYARAFKHNDSPSELDILESINECIMGELYEWFDFEESNED